MLDKTETKTIALGSNSYTIGKVSKKVFTMLMCAMIDAGERTDARAAVLYNYLPFFIVSATVDGAVMPAPITETDGRTSVTHADYEWVAENIGIEDLFKLQDECLEYNQVSEELKKK